MNKYKFAMLVIALMSLIVEALNLFKDILNW